MTEEITWARARGWRLRRHFLAEERATEVSAVVERLGAVPVWSGDAATAIELRLGRPAAAELTKAAAEGRVFATYAFRGATHYLTATTAAAILSLRCASRQWELKSWCSYYDLEPADWPVLREAARDALAGGPLSQEDLAAAVTASPRFRHLRPALLDRSHTVLKPFGWQGDLCFAPSPKGATFRLLDGLPGWAGLLDLDEAGPRAIRAYLAAYGPAEADRIHYWLGSGLSAGRRRIDGWIRDLNDELAVLSVEGAAVLCRTEDVEAITRATPSDAVTLLPGSDQWVLGPGTAAPEVVPPDQRAVATRGANLALVGGLVQGTWMVKDDVVRLRWFEGVDRAPAPAVSTAVDDLARAQGRRLGFAA